MLDATARAEDRHFWFRALRRNAAQLLVTSTQVRPGPRTILDCGAGTGRNLDWLQRLGPAAGVELTPAGLAVGQRRGRAMVRATVARLPVADGSLDVATSFDVLYCLEDDVEQRAIAEMFRALRPGGVALFNVAALDILRGSHSALTHERRRYTPDRLAARLTRAGFVVERMTFTNMATFPLTLGVRVFDRLAGRAATASETDLTVPVWPINEALNAILWLEGVLLRWIDLPVGSSLLCLARKPGALDGCQRETFVEAAQPVALQVERHEPEAERP